MTAPQVFAMVASMSSRLRDALGICAALAAVVACAPSGPAAQPTGEPTDAPTQSERSLEPGEVVDLGSVASTENLEKLRPLVENARVVLLGEANHGDGASVHAISRLVRYLHEELDFEVFALESGLYDCDRAWQLAQQRAPAEELANACAFRNWREIPPMGELWSYLVSQVDSESPLILAGFDNQFSSAPGQVFVDDLVATLEAHGVRDELPEGWRDPIEAAIKKLQASPPPDREPQERERHRAALRAALDALRSSEVSRDEETSKWVRILEGALSVEHSRWLYQQAERAITDEDLNLRDEEMAKNLIWLLERYPDKRFVVWAATMHTARNPTLLGPLDHGSHTHDMATFRPMGDRLVSKLPELDVVSIAFVGLEGMRGRPRGPASDLPEPPSGSFEAAALATGIDYGLVDLRAYRGSDHWLAGSFSSAALATHMEAPWGRVVDAIAFIRTMTPNRARDN